VCVCIARVARVLDALVAQGAVSSLFLSICQGFVLSVCVVETRFSIVTPASACAMRSSSTSVYSLDFFCVCGCAQDDAGAMHQQQTALKNREFENELLKKQVPVRDEPPPVCAARAALPTLAA
jgi:hypothetical protein